MSKKISLENLVGVERSIEIFDNNNNDLREEIEINIPLKDLLTIVEPNKEDPLLYEFYPLTKEQVNKMLEFTKNSIVVDFTNHYYVLACYGIYK
jgi:Mg/Co/Ni transporter MgtE